MLLVNNWLAGHLIVKMLVRILGKIIPSRHSNVQASETSIAAIIGMMFVPLLTERSLTQSAKSIDLKINLNLLRRDPDFNGRWLTISRNGEAIVIRVAFKPTATIRKEQQTINAVGEATTLSAKGRHDPCVLPRAVPMVEAMVSLVLADHLLLVLPERPVVRGPLAAEVRQRVLNRPTRFAVVKGRRARQWRCRRALKRRDSHTRSPEERRLLQNGYAMMYYYHDMIHDSCCCYIFGVAII